MFALAEAPSAFLDWLRAEHWGWTVLGFSSMSLFFLRFFIQWVSSEKAKRIVMPVAFWRISLLGGLLWLPYTLHLWREPLIIGAIVSLIVSIGNLELALHQGKPRSPFWKAAPFLVPTLFAVFVIRQLILDPWSWETIGYFGEVLFSSRFVLQWMASERKGAIVVPGYFWHLSLGGSSVRLIYAVHVGKMPLLLSTIVTLLMSLRNALLHHSGARMGSATGPGIQECKSDGRG